MRSGLVLLLILAACEAPLRSDFNARVPDGGVPPRADAAAGDGGSQVADAGPGNATVVSVDEDRDASLGAGQEHLYRFVALDAPNHRMETLGASDTWCELRTGDGEALDTDDDSGEGLNCAIERAITPGRAYELLVRHFRDTGEGDYTLRISAIHPAEIDPQIEQQAERVPAGQSLPITGTGFTALGLVRIELSGPTPIPAAEVQVGEDGRFSYSVRTTLDTAPGAYSVRAVDQASGIGSLWLDWFVDAPGADDHGNDRMSASELTVGVPSPGQIEEAGDEDWFRVLISRPGDYTVETRGETDTRCAFVDDQDQVIGTESDDDGDRLNCRGVESLGIGTYWVRVRAYQTHTGAYEVVVIAPDVPDDHGNDRMTATLTHAAGVVTGEIGEAGDQDWFAFNAFVGGIYTLRTIGGLDSFCELYDHRGDLVVGDDNSGLGDNCQIERVLPGHSVWYLAVRHARAEGTGGYMVFMSGAGREPEDDHGNVPDNATLVADTGTVNGRFEAPSDEDVIRFATPVAGTWTLSTEGDSDTRCVLSDEAGTQLAEDDDSGERLNCRVEHALLAGRIYTFAVRPFRPSATGAYRILLTR